MAEMRDHNHELVEELHAAALQAAEEESRLHEALVAAQTRLKDVVGRAANEKQAADAREARAHGEHATTAQVVKDLKWQLTLKDKRIAELTEELHAQQASGRPSGLSACRYASALSV